MANTLMRAEALSAPEVIAKQLTSNATVCRRVANDICAFDPEFVYIIGRGSSDHAGVFAKYLIEVELGIAVSSAAPSVFSIFKQRINLKRALVLVISQSGASPDIIEQTKAAKEAGAFTVGLINTPNSPLSAVVAAEICLHAGSEKAVAATKSYLATLSAALQLIAYWKEDKKLLEALAALPNAMLQAQKGEAKLRLEHVKNLSHCIVLGRGFGFAISKEIALKLKEVCSIHAEAFSSAEFLHGPVALANKPLCVLDVAVEDESFESHNGVLSDLRSRGLKPHAIHLRNCELHYRLLPLLTMQRFYLDIEHLAIQMGFDPDSPAGLNKVTKTL
uniref:glucosamine-6-phosphate deaminase NagB-II n=1 Tax=Ningiella ruwaisensis TaxID=2364274 RepID=UPI0010A09511|nr:SIS domain-containing protein [Ningiella ruwaisensis]